MISSVEPLVETLRSQVRHLPPVQRVGTVTAVTGLVIESDGPNVGLGELCLVRSPRSDFSVRAEVVGFREHRLLLMPLGDMDGLHVGCEVAACQRPPLPRPGPEMLGRVLDALGRPFDGLGVLPADRRASVSSTPPPVYLQVYDAKANPVISSNSPVTPVTGQARYHVLTVPTAKQTLGDPPAEVRAVASPPVTAAESGNTKQKAAVKKTTVKKADAKTKS